MGIFEKLHGHLFPFELKCERYGTYQYCKECKKAHESSGFSGVANFENYVRHKLVEGFNVDDKECWYEIIIRL